MIGTEEVKRDLPYVKIKWAGKLYWGRISGRMNQFATVSPYQPINRRKLLATIMGPCFHFSWEAVARAVSGDCALDSGI